ncbi:MAG: M20/M25/M40 family metallo-hydrolase, partial [Myxococcota bacterium]|nr:M20/M25/M40 family metallo-hydrolase [Myxococcota bacterium]
MSTSSRTEASIDPERLQAAVAQLVRLVNAASVSGDEAPAVEEAARIAAEIGLAVERMPVAAGRENLLVGDANPAVILCTHLDTVPPHIPARLDETHVHGRGSADAKGIAIAMLHGLASLVARGAGDGIACLLVVGEETDHAGAQAAAASRLRPTHIVLGEPCGLTPARAQKGLLKLVLTA